MATQDTIYVQFNPDQRAGWSFSFSGQDLNGQTQVYTLVAAYNYYAGRYCLRVVSDAGTFSLPLINSPDNFNIYMNAGYMTTPIVFRGRTQVLEIG